MYQGTYHYVQRYVGTHEGTEVWIDVPFEDGSIWRSQRFVTAANYVDSLRAQELSEPGEPVLERYRVVKRSFQEEVIVPRWMYVEILNSAGTWDRALHGTHDWRSRTFSAAQAEIKSRLQELTAEAQLRIVNQDGAVQAVFTRADFDYSDLVDLYEDEDDDDEEDEEYDGADDLTKTVELSEDEPVFETDTTDPDAPKLA